MPGDLQDGEAAGSARQSAYLYIMGLDTAIFDMDGLIIDSEPLWHEAANEVLAQLGVEMDEATYATTVGLRTSEFLDYWFDVYGVDKALAAGAEEDITERVIRKVGESGLLMPGVKAAIDLLADIGFKIGLATSSPYSLIEAVLSKTGLTDAFQVRTSAEGMPHGKPHPAVYLSCAESLGSSPGDCLCFEDSFNGMIAAKAARMRCIVVPTPPAFDRLHWEAADRKLASLEHFNLRILSDLTTP